MSHSNPTHPKVMRAGSGQCLYLGGEIRYQLLDSQESNDLLHLSYCRVLPAAPRPFSVLGQECLIVESGTLQLQVRDKALELNTRDVAFFPNTINGELVCTGEEPATLFRASILKIPQLPGGEVPQTEVIRANEGECLEAFGEHARVVLSSNATKDQFCLVEVETPALCGSPLHIHDSQNRLFIIRDGHYEFCLDDARVQAAAGDAIFVPHQAPQSYRVVSAQPGRFFLLTVPAGYDSFFREAARLCDKELTSSQNWSVMGDGDGLRFLSPRL